MNQRIKLRVVHGFGLGPEAKEVNDTTICWQGGCHSILGRKMRYYDGHFTKEKYNHWSVDMQTC